MARAPDAGSPSSARRALRFQGRTRLGATRHGRFDPSLETNEQPRWPDCQRVGGSVRETSAICRPRCCRHESLQVLRGRTFELPGPHSGMLRAHFWISIAHRVRSGERYLGCRRNDCRYLSETLRYRTPCARPTRDVCPPHFRFAMTLASKAAQPCSVCVAVLAALCILSMKSVYVKL